MNSENEFPMFEKFKEFVMNSPKEHQDERFEYIHIFNELKNIHNERWRHYLPGYDEKEDRFRYIELEIFYENENEALFKLYGYYESIPERIVTFIKSENSIKEKIKSFFDKYPNIKEVYPTLKEDKFPAPEWLVYPELSTISMGWRMGYGEDYLMFLSRVRINTRKFSTKFKRPKNWSFNDNFTEYMEHKLSLYAIGWSDKGLPKYNETYGEKYVLSDEFTSRLLNEGFRIDHVRYRNLKEGHLDSKIMALENGSDWKKSKYSVLLNLLYYKVTEDSYLINELFKTGDKALSINPEDPYWIDEKLDLALMELRDEINDLYEHRDKIDWIYTEFLKVAPFDYNSHQSNGMINQNTAEYRVYENTYSDAKLFVRDTNLTRKQEEKYTVGKIIQERAFIDSTPKIGRMTTSHRYAILSNHIKDLSEYEKETDWSLHTTAANSQFKILDVYEYKGKTQILLLHLINGFSSVFEDNWTIKKEFVENAREIFEKSFEKEVIESVNSEMWLQRCEFPIGLDPNDDYWPIENF